MKATFGLIGVAMLVALMAAWGCWNAYESARRGWTLVTITSAAVDVEAGMVLSPAMIQETLLPNQFVSAGAVRPQRSQDAIGKKLLIPLKRGDPLLWSQFQR